MKLIYIAGKYRADNDWDIVQNIKKAEAAAIRLWKEGWAVICPHLNTQLFTCCSQETFLEGGLEMLKGCKAIYMLDNYLDSEGALKELELAKELGLEVIYE